MDDEVGHGITTTTTTTKFLVLDICAALTHLVSLEENQIECLFPNTTSLV
jgi:hypothetical protein